MNYIEHQTECGHADQLISFVYNEGSVEEINQFQDHLRTCSICQTEIRSLGGVRQLIADWKIEALSSAVESRVQIPASAPRAKSAVAALREFFDLSPLWLKGVTALATVLFFLAIGLGLSRLGEEQPTIVKDERPGAIYTEDEMKQAIKKALDEQNAIHEKVIANLSEPQPVKPASPKRNSNRSSMAQGRRPLTRREREQLAVDLRLVERSEDIGLELLSEPINRELRQQ